MFGALYQAPGPESGTLVEIAREFSSRIEICAAREIVLDLSGLSALFGDARAIAEQMRRTAADRGLRVRVAIAGTRTAARLLVRHRAGLTVIAPGTEAAVLAALPLALLEELGTPPTPFRRWGLKTCGELAALPPDAVMARLGGPGIDWQRLARGEDARPLVPAVPEERFEQSLELEWPIDGLEPLSFVLGRLMEPLSAHLAQRDRGAAVLHIRLRLVTRNGTAKVVHERSLQLPAPMREARTLRTLALLDLESHPPSAAIDCVTVAVDPTPARVIQHSLLARPLPAPEQLSTLLARLHALLGESRCGSPAAVDSWRPGAFALKPFAPADPAAVAPWPVMGKNAAACTALRRFRMPVPARVQLADGKPARLIIDRRGLKGGSVAACAGPWRTSGAWWTGETGKPGEAGAPWDRDEWDVLLEDGATYRVFRERTGNQWFVDGVVD